MAAAVVVVVVVGIDKMTPHKTKKEKEDETLAIDR